MHPFSLPTLHPLAAIFGLSPFALALTFAMCGMLFGGVIAIVAMYFHHQRGRLWHETTRIALEKGQPPPVPPEANLEAQVLSRPERSDTRTGLILIAVGGGLAVFMFTVGAPQAAGIGAIPGFIGIALLLFGVFSRKQSTANDLPPRT